MKFKRVASLILAFVMFVSFFSITAPLASAATSTTVTTGKYFTIYNVGAKKYLNVYGSKSASNTNITVYAKDGTKGQNFKFTQNGNGYTLTPECGTSCRVNVYGTSASNKANVCTWTTTNSSTQTWVIDKVSNGYLFRCKNNTDYVLTATGSSNSSNVNIQKYSAGNNYQVWTCGAINEKTVTNPPKSDPQAKITTEMIDAVLKKYGYSSGKYWTVLSSSSASGYSNCAKQDHKSSSCTASTKPQGTKSGSQTYMSYNYNNTWECCGFASYVMYNVTGKHLQAKGANATAANGWKVYKSTSDAGSLKVGDIIRYNGHSGIVYTVDSKGNATFVECWGSVDCVIKVNSGWNTNSGTRTISYFNNSKLSYIYRYEG